MGNLSEEMLRVIQLTFATSAVVMEAEECHDPRAGHLRLLDATARGVHFRFRLSCAFSRRLLVTGWESRAARRIVFTGSLVLS